MNPSQTKRLKMLLRSRKGVTAWQIIQICRTTSPHRRLTDLKEAGWVITSVKLPGESFFRYTGTPPKHKGCK